MRALFPARGRFVVLATLALLPAARLALDALQPVASGKRLLLAGAVILGAVAVAAVGSLSGVPSVLARPAAVAHAVVAAGLAVIPPHDERTAVLVGYSALMFACALVLATRSARLESTREPASATARVASATSWTLAALGVAGVITLIVVNLLIIWALGET